MSPAGKRLRTMNDTDDDSDEHEQAPANIWAISSANFYGPYFSRQGESESQTRDRRRLQNERDYSDIEHMQAECFSPANLPPDLYPTTNESNTDTSVDDDDDDDEASDAGDDRSEDYEDIGEYYDGEIQENEIDYMSDSEDSSGYQDYHGIMAPQDYEVEDDSLGPDSEDDEDEVNQCLPDEYLKHDPTPDAPYPKPDWITINELRNRKYGFASTRQTTKRSNMYWFEKYASNSLWMIQRLQLEKKLQGHTGCVNCLDFNSSGNLICSGSDDLLLCIWDWQNRGSQPKATIPTGHTSNVFQSQFCNSDKSIITSARDGTVRIVDIETNVSELLLSSSGEIGRLAFITPQTLVTCGTNAAVNHIDLRTRETTKLLVVRNPKNNRTFPLHSINVHPLDKHKIAVAGSLQYVFLYDLRRIARNHYNDVENKPTHCLGNFENSNHIVTSTAFNSTGDKLLVSYNDDDLYVCRTDTCQVVHKYQGHRNKKTIKGCAWFGDNFVLSGSDDGHIYGWDLQSEHIVCFLEGDNGVVNCLCVHPDLPVLASSGLDHDVKLWEPVSSTWPQTLKGIKPQICKNTMRRKRAHERRIRPPDTGDDASDTDL